MANNDYYNGKPRRSSSAQDYHTKREKASATEATTDSDILAAREVSGAESAGAFFDNTGTNPSTYEPNQSQNTSAYNSNQNASTSSSTNGSTATSRTGNAYAPSRSGESNGSRENMESGGMTLLNDVYARNDIQGNGRVLKDIAEAPIQESDTVKGKNKVGEWVDEPMKVIKTISNTALASHMFIYGEGTGSCQSRHDDVEKILKVNGQTYILGSPSINAIRTDTSQKLKREDILQQANSELSSYLNNRGIHVSSLSAAKLNSVIKSGKIGKRTFTDDEIKILKEYRDVKLNLSNERKHASKMEQGNAVNITERVTGKAFQDSDVMQGADTVKKGISTVTSGGKALYVAYTRGGDLRRNVLSSYDRVSVKKTEKKLQKLDKKITDGKFSGTKLKEKQEKLDQLKNSVGRKRDRLKRRNERSSKILSGRGKREASINKFRSKGTIRKVTYVVGRPFRPLGNKVRSKFLQTKAGKGLSKIKDKITNNIASKAIGTVLKQFNLISATIKRYMTKIVIIAGGLLLILLLINLAVSAILAALTPGSATNESAENYIHNGLLGSFYRMNSYADYFWDHEVRSEYEPYSADLKDALCLCAMLDSNDGNGNRATILDETVRENGLCEFNTDIQYTGTYSYQVPVNDLIVGAPARDARYLSWSQYKTPQGTPFFIEKSITINYYLYETDTEPFSSQTYYFPVRNPEFQDADSYQENAVNPANIYDTYYKYYYGVNDYEDTASEGTRYIGRWGRGSQSGSSVTMKQGMRISYNHLVSIASETNTLNLYAVWEDAVEYTTVTETVTTSLPCTFETGYEPRYVKKYVDARNFDGQNIITTSNTISEEWSGENAPCSLLFFQKSILAMTSAVSENVLSTSVYTYMNSLVDANLLGYTVNFYAVPSDTEYATWQVTDPYGNIQTATSEERLLYLKASVLIYYNIHPDYAMTYDKYAKIDETGANPNITSLFPATLFKTWDNGDYKEIVNYVMNLDNSEDELGTVLPVASESQ